jgi:hypothetical protein
MPPTDAGAEVGGNPLWLLTLVLLLMRWVGGTVVVHHPVPGRSTIGRSCYGLPLLCILVCADCMIHDNDITDKLWE